jgi:hypothetical protein
MKTVNLMYSLTDWKETTVEERADGFKTTRVEAAFAYKGDLAGPAKAAYLMLYHPDQSGTYYGWEYFEGTWNGAKAAVVFHIEGSFDPKGVDAGVVGEDKSSTGSLEGLRLKYRVRFEGPGPYPIELNVD